MRLLKLPLKDHMYILPFLAWYYNVVTNKNTLFSTTTIFGLFFLQYSRCVSLNRPVGKAINKKKTVGI